MPRTKASTLYKRRCSVFVSVRFQNTLDVFFDVRLRRSCAGGGMERTVCLGVCLLGWVVGCSLWCLILFLYVNRFKWHIFEVPTRRSVSGYIVTAHRCHCIHDCYCFSRAISHILATWKESTTIENLDNVIKPQDMNTEHLFNRSDILTNQLFYIYCIRHIFPSIFVTCLSEELILESMFGCFGPSFASALTICACLEVHEECYQANASGVTIFQFFQCFLIFCCFSQLFD